ncbi:MAG: tRNA (adenosine(37)-N6)-dimethylallyltransferase MiaA [Acidobacteriota bacterium]
MDSKNKLLIILGPTAVGKSRTAIKLAKLFEGEIINCDAIQVYQGFNIGTDKIPPEKREGIPHHLLDEVPPTQQFTAADFVNRAVNKIKEIEKRKRLPIIAGGTGLYLKALLEGLFPGVGRQQEIREQLEMEAQKKGVETLWKKLQQVDPQQAQKINHGDKIRIIRALEVFEATGIPISQHFLKTKSPLKNVHTIKIGLKLDRTQLYKRINERVDQMFKKGLVEEVMNLLEKGVSPETPPFKALGYRHVLDYLNQKTSLEEAVLLTQRDTRRYAKRQMTWFRKMEGIHWFHPYDLASLEKYGREKLN